MDSVTIREAREHLSDLVKAAEHGESVVITRRGRKVAQLVPVSDKAGRRLPDLTEFRATIRSKGKPLSAVVVERRKAERY